MPNAKERSFKKIEQNLFLPLEEAQENLSPGQLERKNRTMLCVSKKMDDPFIPEVKLIEFLMDGCGAMCEPVSRSTAYRDMAMVGRIIGNIQLSAKSWYQYMIIEGAKEAFAIAKKEDDAQGMSSALNVIGKYTRADKNDEEFDFDSMIPPSFEPTDDISILGDDYKEMTQAEIKARADTLRKLFSSKASKDDAIDVEYIEMEENG